MKRALPFLLIACAPAPAPAPAPKPTPPATVEVETPPPAPETPEPPPPPPPPKEQPTDAIIGKLSLTKGAQPVIAGRMLASDAMAERFGEKWRDFEGQRFRVRGEKHDHVCDPRAQCMIGGVIPLIRNITAIERCKGCGGEGDVACPVSPEELEACMSSCQKESSRCDAGAKGNRGRLKRCGSKRISCRQACKKYGEPNPFC